MSLLNRILINAVSIYVAKIFEALLQLGVLTFVLHKVGKEYYAAALLIISIQSTIDLARGGMQKATLKYISEYKSKGELLLANSILSSSSLIQGLIGVIGFFICLLISRDVTGIFSLPDYMQSEAQLATIYLGIGIVFLFVLSPWHNSLSAQERYDLVSVAFVFGKMTRALLIIALLLIGYPSLISLVFATIAGVVFEKILCLFFVKKISPDIMFKAKTIHYLYIKKILRFSFFDFFHTLSGFLYLQGSLFLVAHILSLDAVAGLGIIFNITMLIGMAMNQFTHTLVPVASRLQAELDNGKIRFLIISGTKLVVFSGGIGMVCLIPWMKSLLNVWLGVGYTHLVWPALILLTASYFVNSIGCIHNILGGIGKVSVDGISNALCTGIGLIIGAALVFTTTSGLFGFALGLLCARLLRFFTISWYGARVFDIPYRPFMSNAFLRSFILVGLMGLSLLVSDRFQIDTWFLLVLAAGLTGILYFVTGIFVVPDNFERERLLRAFFEGGRFLKSRFCRQNP